MKEELSDKSFMNALFLEDELGSVIRVHLHVEHLVNEILKQLTPYPEELKPMNLDYDDKVNLICALGFEPKLKTMLSVLGKMRNKFAHDPHYKLSKSEVKNLYQSLSEFDKQALHESHNKTRNSEEYRGQVGAYNVLNPKNQFILIAVIIRNVLGFAIDDIKKNKCV